MVPDTMVGNEGGGGGDVGSVSADREGVGVTIIRRVWTPVLIASGALLLTACPPMDPGPSSTTASTSSTSSTSSTTIDPSCGDYTPSGVMLSTGSASAGDSITVSGNGTAGTTIVLTLRRVSDSAVEDPGVTTVVGGGGTWATGLTLPNSLTSEEWLVVATAQGCTAEATASIDIV